MVPKHRGGGGEVDDGGKVGVVAAVGSTFSIGNVWERGRCGYVGSVERAYCGVANGPCVVSGEKVKGVAGLDGSPENELTVSVNALERDVVLCEFECRYSLEL